jgi:hypothetical protein
MERSAFHTPSGRYFANESDAAFWTKVEQEREQRESERRAAYLARQLENVAIPTTRDEALGMPMPVGKYAGLALARVPAVQLVALFDHLEAKRAAGSLSFGGRCYLVALERILGMVPAGRVA